MNFIAGMDRLRVKLDFNTSNLVPLAWKGNSEVV